jgi:hypothetical protein
MKESLARYRVPLVLGLLVAGLATYIVVHERHTLTSAELEQRRGRLLERFVRARCDRIELERPARAGAGSGDAASAGGAGAGGAGAGGAGAGGPARERVVLVRVRDDAAPGLGGALDVGSWRILSPVEAPADEDAVSALLGALEWLDARRTFEGGAVDPREEARMGLDAPRVRVTLTVARETITLALGAEDARGQGVYLRVGSPGAPVHVVGKDFFEAVDHDAAHFRSKRVLEGPQSPRLADRVTLRAPGRPALRLRREVARWHFDEGAVGWASRDAVDAITRALDELRAERFVAERLDARADAAQLAAYGLSPPAADVVVEVPPPFGQDGGPRTGVRLRVGGPCPTAERAAGDVAGGSRVGAGEGGDRDAGDVGDRDAVAGDATAAPDAGTLAPDAGTPAPPRDVYAWVGERGPLVCVRADAVAGLVPELGALRERRLLVAEDTVVEKLTLRAGDRVLTVARDGDGWKRSGEGGEGDADPDAVARLLSGLRALEPTAYEPATDDAALRARGLSPPRATLVVDRGEDLGTETLALGSIEGDTCFARRDEEPVALRVPASLAELLDPSPLRVRGLRVLAEDDATATELRVARRGQPEERIVRVGAAFRVVAPVQERAGLGRTAGALRAFGTLRAERWVADRAAPAHGLDAPRATVSVRFAPDGEASGAAVRAPYERTLTIGAPAAGGAYARVDGEPAVFVLPDATVAELLDRPYVAADAAACDRDRIERVEVERPAPPAGARGGAAVRFVVTRAGDGFAASGPGAPAGADGAAAVVTAIAELLAQPRAYGTPAPGAPAATVRVSCGGAEPRRYAFTLAPRGDGAFALRLSESGVELEARARDVEALLGAAATTARSP